MDRVEPYALPECAGVALKRAYGCDQDWESDFLAGRDRSNGFHDPLFTGGCGRGYEGNRETMELSGCHASSIATERPDGVPMPSKCRANGVQESTALILVTSATSNR